MTTPPTAIPAMAPEDNLVWVSTGTAVWEELAPVAVGVVVDVWVWDAEDLLDDGTRPEALVVVPASSGIFSPGTTMYEDDSASERCVSKDVEAF